MHVLQCRVPKYMYLSLYQNNIYHTRQGLEKYSDRAQRVRFWSRIGLKTSIDFDHYGRGGGGGGSID